MKKLVLTAMVLAISTTAIAKPIISPMQFAKGSSCAYFEGSVANRIFTLNLKAKQDLAITIQSSKGIYPIVKNPKGKTLHEKSGDSPEVIYQVDNQGQYRIAFDLADEYYPFAEVKICAY